MSGANLTMRDIDDRYKTVLAAYIGHDKELYSEEIAQTKLEHARAISQFVAYTMCNSVNGIRSIRLPDIPHVPLAHTSFRYSDMSFFKSVRHSKAYIYDELTPPPSPLRGDGDDASDGETPLVPRIEIVQKEKKPRRRSTTQVGGLVRIAGTDEQEQQREDALRELLEEIGPCPAYWSHPPCDGQENVTKRPKMRQGNKASRTKYTDSFTKWVERVSHALVQIGQQHGSCYRLERTCIYDQCGHPLEEGSRETIRVPADERCMGCRRYYLSPDDNTKVPVFHLCYCPVRASYCIRCKIIQWATFVDDAYKRTGELVSYDTRTPCGMRGCNGSWGLVDLLFLVPGSTMGKK